MFFLMSRAIYREMLGQMIGRSHCTKWHAGWWNLEHASKSLWRPTVFCFCFCFFFPCYFNRKSLAEWGEKKWVTLILGLFKSTCSSHPHNCRPAFKARKVSMSQSGGLIPLLIISSLDILHRSWYKSPKKTSGQMYDLKILSSIQ